MELHPGTLMGMVPRGRTVARLGPVVGCAATSLFLLVNVLCATGDTVQTQPTALPPDEHHEIPGSAFNATSDNSWLSPVVQPAVQFNELIYSWQQEAPGDSFRLHLQVGFGDGTRSDWLDAGYWGEVPHLTTNRAEPSFEQGVLAMDYLKLSTPAATFQFKVTGYTNAPLAGPPALTVIVTDTRTATDAETPPPASEVGEAAMASILDVPLRRQFDSNGTRLIDRCQSAALASALEYFGTALPLEQITDLTFDVEYQYPGIWPRVIAAAREFGFDGRIERFRNWTQVRQALAKNQIILCSIRLNEGECTSPPYPSMGNHIVALCGVTSDGRVVVTDSALGKSGRGYLCQWLQPDFETVWMKNKNGIAMVIHPPNPSPTHTVDELPPFPHDRPFPKGDDH